MTTPRWYMVNKMGMATLCTDKEGAEQEAADAQRLWPHMGPHRAVQLVEVGTSARGLIDAAKAVIDRWDTPLWKDVEPTAAVIGRLRAAVASEQTSAWVPLPGTLPEPGKPVLLDIGEEYPIRAVWAAKHTLEVGMEDDSEFGEYDEATDTYYCPEGWYEWNEHEDVHWRVTETPRAWAPLPPITSAGSVKGE